MTPPLYSHGSARRHSGRRQKERAEWEDPSSSDGTDDPDVQQYYSHSRKQRNDDWDFDEIASSGVIYVVNGFLLFG